MAPPPGTLRVGRYFTALLLLLALLYSIVAFGSRATPKLGIDLVGGVRVIFTAKAPQGKTPSASSMEQARQILEDRINGSGVTQSTVVIQGGDQLVVSIPGGTGTDVSKLGAAAVLNFRGLVAPAVAVSCVQSGSGGASSAPSSGAATSPSTGPSNAATSEPSGTASAAPNDASHRILAAAPSRTARSNAAASTAAASRAAASKAATSPAATSPAATSPAATSPAATSPAATAPASPCVRNPFAALAKTDPKLTVPSTEAAFTALTATQKQEVQAALATFDCAAAQNEKDRADRYYVACDDGTTYGTPVAYLLGQVVVPGRQIDDANAVAPSTGQGGSVNWSVSLTLKGSGSASWAKWTSKYNTTSSSANALSCDPTSGTPCSDFVGFTLDGSVISAPVTQGAINGGATQISGNFQQDSATDLANKLKYGALPLSFRADSSESVSATLGTAQLKAALLAGSIGLILVVIYSLLYYRGLGLVTIASLLVSGGLTYGMLVLLGTQIGFTLDLSGIAGFIVALGITADSFVVFFERIKDEVHEGRSMRVAVPRAWIRARRTVLSADTVSFLAAAILYYFASADVKGFAFTLGLSTILDLVVVFLFTHPIVSLLSRSRAFGSPRFTGLNAVRVGGIIPDEPAPQRRKSAGVRAAGRTDSRAAQARATGAVVLDRSDQDDEESESVADDAPAAPDGGTAAERAAARRARKRAEQADDDGKDS